MNREKKVKVVGKSYYSYPTKAKENLNGQMKYGVGIIVDTFGINKNAENYNILKTSFEKMLKTKEVGTVLIVANSNYPLSVYDKDNKEIENAYIKNDTNIEVVLSFKWSKLNNNFYLTVDGIKILDDYVSKTNPFENNIEFA